MASVCSVNINPVHGFSKQPAARITLVAGFGVQGDAHFGETVKHRSRVAQDPSQPNLRQVHLIHQELLAELATQGFTVHPGDLGENITTEGLDLLALPLGTVLVFDSGVRLRLTGLRNPCHQIDRFCKGLLKQVLVRVPDGSWVRKTGVMAVVEQGGQLGVGDAITLEMPEGQPLAMTPV